MASTSAVAQIMAKLARNCSQLGLTATNNGSTVTVTNSSNALTLSYVAPTLTAPMGGVDPANSPYLGIGVVAPGALKVKSAINSAGTIADVIDGTIAAKVLKMLGGFANDVILENSDATFSVQLRGDVDLVMMGQ